MRNFKAFFIDVTKKPPILFPLVGLFHILWLLLALSSAYGEPTSYITWLEVLWVALYTVCWIAACDMRRWGALGYIFLMLLNMSLYLATRNQMIPIGYFSNMILLDGLFSVMLLFFYKKFR